MKSIPFYLFCMLVSKIDTCSIQQAAFVIFTIVEHSSYTKNSSYFYAIFFYCLKRDSDCFKTTN